MHKQPCNLAGTSEIGQPHDRVRRCFNEEHPRRRRDGRLDPVERGRIDVRERQLVSAQHLLEQPERSCKFVNQTFRFANNNDIVPFLPLSQSDLSVKVPNLVKYLPRTQKLSIVNVSTMIDYYHVGHLKYFDKDGVLHDEGLGIADKWLDRIAGHLDSLLKIAPGSLTTGGLFDRVDLLGDHMMKQFIVNLKKHREEWEMNNKSVSS